MSLYELELLMRSLSRIEKPKQKTVSDEEWAEAEAMLASVTANDPSVSIH